MTTLGQWLRTVDTEHRLEGELLLADRLNITRTQIIAYPETVINPNQLSQLQQDLEALRAGKPLAYITGRREFWSLELYVTPDVLIPRPETELIVEVVCARASHNDRVLDLGTGSGAIALAITHERGDLKLTATERSAAALAVAQENATRLNLNVTWIISDWFDALCGTFDVIVANPPYIRQNDPHLDALHFEPKAALVATDNGLVDLRTIIADASTYLADDGWLMVEHGFDQGNDVIKLMQQHGYLEIGIHNDLSGHHRATSASRG